jgi:Sec-independent protein translocase protein TatA
MVVLTVVLILLGPDKLPEVARKLGATWKAIKNFQEKVETEVREAIPQLPNSGDISRMVRSPIGLLNQLADRASSGDEDGNEFRSEGDVSKLETIFGPNSSTERTVDHVTDPLTTTDPSLN